MQMVQTSEHTIIRALKTIEVGNRVFIFPLFLSNTHDMDVFALPAALNALPGEAKDFYAVDVVRPWARRGSPEAALLRLFSQCGRKDTSAAWDERSGTYSSDEDDEADEDDDDDDDERKDGSSQAARAGAAQSNKSLRRLQRDCSAPEKLSLKVGAQVCR